MGGNLNPIALRVNIIGMLFLSCSQYAPRVTTTTTPGSVPCHVVNVGVRLPVIQEQESVQEIADPDGSPANAIKVGPPCQFVALDPSGPTCHSDEWEVGPFGS